MMINARKVFWVTVGQSPGRLLHVASGQWG